MTTETVTSEDVAPAAEWGTEPHPWRRYGARCIDTFIFGNLFNLIFFFAVAFVTTAVGSPLGAWLAAPPFWAGLMIFGPIAVAGVCLCNPVCHALWGSTPGKWIFRLKVSNADGSRLSYSEAYAREFRLWWRGMGLGLPGVSLLTMILSYNDLDNDGVTSWDRAVGARSSARVIEGAGYAWLVVGTLIVIGSKVADAIASVGMR